MSEVKIRDNILCIGATEISLKNKIMEVKQDENRIFVLLKIPSRKKLDYDDCHNVYCYNSDGKEIWQIGVRPKGDDTVYIAVDIVDSTLFVNDFYGRRFSVNKGNGEIVSMSITK